MRLLVIDHQSQDATADIARAHGATVITRSFEGFVNARRFALSQVHTPWTLMIDADEVLDASLRDAIVATPADADGYEVVRTTYYCGRPMRMWRGERLLRLFATNRVRLVAAPAAGGQAQLHERWTCDGRVAELNGTLLHFSYPTHAAYREKFERYTATEAAGMPGSRVRWLAQLALTPVRFVWYSIAHQAALDGARGIRVAWWSALYPLVVQTKALRQAQGRSIPHDDNADSR